MRRRSHSLWQEAEGRRMTKGSELAVQMVEKTQAEEARCWKLGFDGEG